MPKKGRLGQFVDLREGGLGKKEGGRVFEGGGFDTLMPTTMYVCMPVYICVCMYICIYVCISSYHIHISSFTIKT